MQRKPPAEDMCCAYPNQVPLSGYSDETKFDEVVVWVYEWKCTRCGEITTETRYQAKP